MNTLKQKRVLAGIRATGRLHLGNYLGAVKGMLALQEDPQYETLYMVADAHTITTPYSPEQLRQDRRAVIIDYLAAGLDPHRSTLFIQSDVPQHFELFFLLTSVTTIAKMQHLPTFKDKIKQHPEHSTMALLNYPLLMAADILAYQATLVPVGLDQEPHLEVAREVARRMNNDYGLQLPEPQRFVTAGEYVPSLKGIGKMSKSISGSYISLTDDLEKIAQALAQTPTDSGKGESVPSEGGVANLLTLVDLFEGEAKYLYYKQAYTTTGIRYKELKQDLAQAMFQVLEPIQEKRRQIVADTAWVDDVIQTGAKQAQKIATTTLLEIKDKMGLI